MLKSALLSSCLTGLYLSTSRYVQNVNRLPTYSLETDLDRIASDNERIKFLKESLNNPVRAELLFRASDHHFLAQKFHEKCDGVGNTLTIVRTEYGKTIFAYAAPNWSSDNVYVKDPSKNSCIILLDIKKKIPLIEQSKSIFCHAEYGPTFG